MTLTSFSYQQFRKLWKLWPIKKFSALVLRKLHLMPARFERDFWFEGDFCVYFGEGCLKLSLEEKDHSALDVFWNGLNEGWDAISLKTWSLLAKESTVILDIGANIGLYALTAGISQPAAKIFAFEPGKKSLEILRKNIKLNGFDIHVQPIALSNKNGTATFHDLDVPTAISSLNAETLGSSREHQITYDVEVMRLDDFALKNNLDRIDLISIDVERHEKEVLEGMGSLLANHQPDMIIEILDDEMGRKVQEALGDLPYRYFRIDEQSGLIASENLKRPSDLTKESGYNYLICKEDRIPLIAGLIVNEKLLS